MVDREVEAGEVGLAAQGGDERSHQVLDEGGDDGGERKSDHDRDGEVDHVAAQQKRPEPLHLVPPSVETETTTFPNCSPESSRVSAACTSSNG